LPNEVSCADQDRMAAQSSAQSKRSFD